MLIGLVRCVLSVVVWLMMFFVFVVFCMFGSLMMMWLLFCCCRIGLDMLSLFMWLWSVVRFCLSVVFLMVFCMVGVNVLIICVLLLLGWVVYCSLVIDVVSILWVFFVVCVLLKLMIMDCLMWFMLLLWMFLLCSSECVLEVLELSFFVSVFVMLIWSRKCILLCRLRLRYIGSVCRVVS